VSNIVRDRLVAAGAVTTLVGTRIYVEQLQQDCAMPAIALVLIDTDPQNTLSGEETLENQEWTIECWDATYTGAKALADVVETAMLAAGTDFTAVRTGRDVVFDNAANLRGDSVDFSLWI